MSYIPLLSAWRAIYAYLSGSDAILTIKRASFQVTTGWVAESQENVTMPLPSTGGNGLYYLVCIENTSGELGCIVGNEFVYSGPDVTQVPLCPSGYTALYYALTFAAMPSFSMSYVTDVRVDSVPGNGASVAGSDTYVQYNDGGVFGGDANLTWDKTGQVLTIGGAVRGAAHLYLYSADGDTGPGYDAVLFSGNALAASDSSGGGVGMVGGNGDGAGAGGPIDLTAGDGGATGSGGIASLKAGRGGATSGVGGDLTLGAGEAATSGTGGSATLFGGNGGATSGDGGSASVSAGNAATDGDGGNATIEGGDGANNGNGGNIELTPGAKAGSGTDGVVQIGNPGTNYTQFDITGHQTMVGDAQPWDDVLPYAINPGTGLTALSSEQYGTTGFTFYYWPNNAAANHAGQFFFQIPHKCVEGSNFHLHAHVIPSANGSAGNEDVEYSVSLQWVNIDGTYSTTTNTTFTQVFRVGAADGNKGKLWEFTALNGSGKTLSSDLMIHISRLTKTADRVNDNYTGKVYLRFVDGHMQMDSLGSSSELSK